MTRSSALSPPTNLGQTEKARVAFRETSTAVEKLDVFLNSWTFRSTEYVVDARRALADVLPTSARRPSMTGDHFRRRAATKTQHDSRSRVLDTDLSQTVPSSSGSPRMTNSKVPKVPTFETDAMSPPVQTTTRSEFCTTSSPSTSDGRSPNGSTVSTTVSSHRTPARPLPPEGLEGLAKRGEGFAEATAPVEKKITFDEPQNRIDRALGLFRKRNANPAVPAVTTHNGHTTTTRASIVFSDSSEEYSEHDSEPESTETAKSEKAGSKKHATKIPLRDDNAKALADMAARTRARARAAGVGESIDFQNCTHPFKQTNNSTELPVLGEASGKMTSPKATKQSADETLTKNLQQLLERLTVTKRNGSLVSTAFDSPKKQRHHFKLPKRLEIDDLLGKIEHAAATKIQARWRGFAHLRFDLLKIKNAVGLVYRPRLFRKFVKAFTFWKQHTGTRRRLRTRCRGLSLKHGNRAHYFVGLRLSDSIDDEKAAGGSCDAWDETYSEHGKLGVATRWREWRFVAWSFCRWRTRVAFG
jgi:hypothetical protein